MSTVTPEQQAEIDRRVAAALAGQQPQQPQQPQPQGWAQPQQFPQQFPMQPAGQMQPMQAAQPTGVLVPVELTTPDGRNVTVQFMFPAQYAANPQALMGLIGSLIAQGLPVRAFAQRQQGGGGGWNNNGGGGGGYRGGGYGRRY